MADTTRARSTDSVVIVTGGNKGIGEAIVRRFYADGSTVVISGRSDAAGQALAAELGDRAHFMHCDVTSEEDVAEMVDDTVERFGTLKTFVYNAGISLHKHSQPFFEISAEDFDTTNNVNYRGVFLGMKHAARAMVACQPHNPSIINISSVMGIRGFGTACASYQAAKAGVLGLTSIGAAKLCAYGIRVNAVSPSVTATTMVEKAMATVADEATVEMAMAQLLPLHQRIIHPDEVANAVAFLASDGAASTNGLNFVLDQGWAAGAQGIPKLPGA